MKKLKKIKLLQRTHSVLFWNVSGPFTTKRIIYLGLTQLQSVIKAPSNWHMIEYRFGLIVHLVIRYHDGVILIRSF